MCVRAALPCVFTYIHSKQPPPSAAKLAAVVRPACSLFRGLSPRSRMVRHVQENIVGEETQKKELDFLHRLWYYTEAVARPQQIMREWWNWQTR